MLRSLLSAIILGGASLLPFAPITHAVAAPATHTMATAVDCGNGESCHWIYYYNAAHTQWAGEVSVNCLGNIFTMGDTNTPYVVMTTKAC